jgi:hypothetical protein
MGQQGIAGSAAEHKRVDIPTPARRACILVPTHLAGYQAAEPEPVDV